MENFRDLHIRQPGVLGRRRRRGEEEEEKDSEESEGTYEGRKGGEEV